MCILKPYLTDKEMNANVLLIYFLNNFLNWAKQLKIKKWLLVYTKKKYYLKIKALKEIQVTWSKCRRNNKKCVLQVSTVSSIALLLTFRRCNTVFIWYGFITFWITEVPNSNNWGEVCSSSIFQMEGECAVQQEERRSMLLPSPLFFIKKCCLN